MCVCVCVCRTAGAREYLYHYCGVNRQYIIQYTYGLKFIMRAIITIVSHNTVIAPDIREPFSLPPHHDDDSPL
jgi:hypothetical protein